eukprot:CAMPEP_0201697216 /NCGR_PEP_ID=MMETSP0578-20130828/10013_1 /ASSEMBLY_ACC=CAM_ASM_000663 /TAXON_ID=267565 /ORGANISM="Skeletonema grethea, Strain CCMP 1804" /LENGTH=209 /DNA_ID=CAMNT_0048183317 /DNA_START=109 /DNA_END=735 /DNA_ORIENTATION=-
MKIVSALLLLAAGLANADDDDKQVTCGSAIKLTHVESGGNYYLMSDERQLNSGSGQQLVTAVKNNKTPNGLWQVREAHGEVACEVGTPVKCGQMIRLTHVTTNNNLHTHGIKSPLSNQHEVTGFGKGEGDGDRGDNWKVVCDAGGYFSSSPSVYWERSKPMMLQSETTGRFLGSSSSVQFTQQNCGRNCPIMNHQEVFGRGANDQYTQW